jgi:hypothetical protein
MALREISKIENNSKQFFIKNNNFIQGKSSTNVTKYRNFLDAKLIGLHKLE